MCSVPQYITHSLPPLPPHQAILSFFQFLVRNSCSCLEAFRALFSSKFIFLKSSGCLISISPNLARFRQPNYRIRKEGVWVQGGSHHLVFAMVQEPYIQRPFEEGPLILLPEYGFGVQVCSQEGVRHPRSPNPKIGLPSSCLMS